MKPNFSKLVSLMAAGMAVQAAYAGNITDINVSVLPDQQRVIKVKFDRDVKQPTGFVTASPARIALDFAGTGVQFSQGPLSFNDSLLNQVMVAQNDDKARLLLGLTKESQYNTQIKGNEIWIFVSESGSTSAPAATGNSSVQQFTGHFGLDFHTGANRSGVIDFRLNSENEPKVKVQSDRVVITLKNYQISTDEQKNLDVTDFSTPVRTITANRIGNDTQIIVRNQGTWQHRLTPRSGGRYSLTITPTVNTVAEANKAALNFGNTKKPQKSFSGKNISLDFQDIEVRTVLQILAKESGVNIVASDSVQGKMTLSLKNVPWDQALDLVLSARDLVMEKNGNIINIRTNEEAKKERMANAEERAKLDDLVPMVSQTFQLKYKNVEELRTVLKIDERGGDSSSRAGTLLTKRGSAMIDPATNTLIVKDIASVVQEFQRLIDELDVPARQVMVETRIVEADVSVGRDLGVKFGYARAGHTGIGGNMNSARINRNVGVGASTGSIEFGPNINLPTVATATTALGLVRSIGSSALGLELSAMENENRSKTISSPRVLTQDRREAEIKQGTQIPYQTSDGNGGYTTAFKDAVLSLKVTPRITPDNNIIMDVLINKDDIDSSNQNADGEPAISVKQVKTQAMVENGGTLVVGGVYQERMSNNVKKVPLLGDVPVLGNLFKSRSREHARNEVLFFITPRIIEGQSSTMRY